MGWISAAIRLVCHFTIALTAATVYCVTSRKLRVLLKHPVFCGLLYGELVFVFMYFVVLPLSALGPAQFNIATYTTGPIGHPSPGWATNRAFRPALLKVSRQMQRVARRRWSVSVIRLWSTKIETEQGFMSARLLASIALLLLLVCLFDCLLPMKANDTNQESALLQFNARLRFDVSYITYKV
jgi:hypothetical protein